MEGTRPKPPTVVPLSKNLLEHLQRSLLQQQRLGQSGHAIQQDQTQAAMPEREKAPLNATQLGKTKPQREQARLTLSGQQQQNGQGSHTAISLQVLNNPHGTTAPACYYTLFIQGQDN